MKKLILVGALLLCLVGCSPSDGLNSTVADTALPKEAKSIKQLGSNWVTFQLNVGGKQRTFMYHRMTNGAGREVIVELRD